MKTLIVAFVSVLATVIIDHKATTGFAQTVDSLPISLRMGRDGAAARIFERLDVGMRHADHAYILTATEVIPCFPTGPDDNSATRCEMMVAKSILTSEPYNEPLRKRYLKLKAEAEYCGLCGPTGPQGKPIP